MKIFRRYLLITFTFAALLGSAGVALNYNVDPASLFGDRSHERQIARHLLSNQHVLDVGEYDFRTIKKHHLLLSEDVPEVVVLGSSRSLEIQKRHFPTQSFYNYGVPGIRLHDYLAFTEIFDQKGMYPSTVVIGLDPWLFLGGYRAGLWDTLIPEFERMQQKLLPVPMTPEEIEKAEEEKRRQLEWERQKTALDKMVEFLEKNKKYKELISLRYLEESIKQAIHNWQYPQPYYASLDLPRDMGGIRSDGSRYQPKKIYEDPIREISAIALKDAKDEGWKYLRPYNRFSHSYVELFGPWIDLLLEKKCRLVFFLAPYHPVAYDELMAQPNGKTIRKFERFINDVAQKKGIEVLGSFDPSQTPCQRVDFDDGSHPSEKCMDKMFISGSAALLL